MTPSRTGFGNQRGWRRISKACQLGILVLVFAGAACGNDEPALRMKLGQIACDVESHAVLGRAVDVIVVRDGSTPYLAYVLERDRDHITVKPSELAFADACHPNGSRPLGE